MRKLLLAATAAVAIASPAAARDGAWYAGIEGGVLIIDDIEFDYEDANGRLENAFIFDHSTGFDVDIIGGYDFGMLRAEAEIGYKRASLDRVFPGDPFPGVPENSLEADGHASAISSMVNLLLDFGDDTGWSGYLGGGVGLARLKYDADVPAFDVGFSDTDDVVAWQGIAGVRMAVSPTMEVGVKYRYFRPADFKFGVADGDVPFRAEGRWQSHSLLASLIFNFAPPPPPVVIAPPPPPPPPPPPATQTCPDGSVILATDVCPLPPPPPPPPPPAGERG